MTTTSPGESAHIGLKGWLKTGRSDILTFSKKMGPFYDHHAQRYQADLARLRNQASVVFTADAYYRFYHELVRILTTSSLLLVRKQKEKCQAELKRHLNQSNYVIPACSGVYNQTMGLPCSHQLEKYLPNNENDTLTVQKELFDTWRLIPQPTRELDEVSVRLQEPQIRTHRMFGSQRVVALHARNSGTFGAQREATRSERVRPDNRVTPPIEGIGSSEMPIVFPTDPLNVSLIQSARRNGIPPPRKRTRLMKPIPPPGTRPCNCNKGCSTRSCRCRKEERSCSICCHGRSCSCENMENSESTEYYSPPGVPDAASSTIDLSNLIRKREYLQQQMMANEAALHELEGHHSNGALTIAYPETVLTLQVVTSDVRAVNNRRASLNTHSQPLWRIIEIEDAEVNENIDDNEGEFR
ncbi:hypothetical protein K3495_g12151 [Podosphaera aphanis]|nr:hypothetical protein K3495_g12151 [Podosphaera aphanis]